MPESYSQTIARLIAATPFSIDTEIQVKGRPPSMASSEFLTNKEQGDWAERIVFKSINDNLKEYIAVQYGRSDSLAAGDEGFADFYLEYQDELNNIGKKPDLLIFRRADFTDSADIDLSDDNTIKRAVAAIEVRSSSFMVNKYSDYMKNRGTVANAECERIRQQILSEPLRTALKEKSPEILNMLQGATTETFRELDFRLRSWSSSPVLRELSDNLKLLKEQIKILHKRDYLSITPKLEDLALVNRWIQLFGVRHYYLQVFFDKAYVISFKEILEISSDPSKEDVVFSVERDVKNQGKTTIKINVQVGREILGKIDMPEHVAALKELDRGRLLFYVTFQGGHGYLDSSVFFQEIINDV
ncbi:MAG: AccI family restriction endonuclease [Snowella sp.]|nr:AccI family restriction endonuclease [Snowella sp.]